MTSNPEYADVVEDTESLVQPLHPPPSDDDRDVEEVPPPAPLDDDREVALEDDDLE
jgi:hypothetical protein